MGNYKCNLVVPGFAKSGTSSLHEYLDIHPKICMSKPKETHFFAIDERYEKGSKFHNGIFEWKSNNEYCYYGESSTIHSIWEPALQRIKKDLNGPKIIVLLRDPVERLISHYKWLWSLTLEKRPLLKAIREEDQKGFNPKVSLRGNYACYLLASSYSYWCPLILSIFGQKNVLFLDSNELFFNKEKAVNSCFSFLELENITIENEIHENKTGTRGIQRTLGISYLTRIVPNTVKDTIDPERKIVKYLYNVLGKKRAKNKPSINQEEILEVKRLLSDDITFYTNIFAK
jgi:hypothetical protein